MHNYNYTKTYFTHDNGGRPFKVDINENTNLVEISSCDYNKRYYELNNRYDYKKIAEYTPKKIFVGKSKHDEMTDNGGGHGNIFDGNSILLDMNDNIYIHIGSNVFSFKTLNEINEYYSPVGNNDVPYPYAVDIKGYVYLLTTPIILSPNDKLTEYLSDQSKDPSLYYFKYHLITPDRGYIPPEMPVYDMDVEFFYIGKNKYTLTYTPNPEKEYERFTKSFKRDKVDEYGISVVDYKGNKTHLTKEMYVDMMKKFGKLAGFQKLEKLETICKRL